MFLGLILRVLHLRITATLGTNGWMISDLVSLGIIAKELDVQANGAEVKASIGDILFTVQPIDILINNAGYILDGAVEKCRYI